MWLDRSLSKVTACKTINIGGSDAESLKSDLTQRRCYIGPFAEGILQYSISPVPNRLTQVTVAMISVGDLGYETFTSYRDVFNRAIEIGFTLCPAEIGPQLRLQYLDQRLGDWLRIAMKPIITTNGCNAAFTVGHSLGELWLYAYDADPDKFCHPAVRLVFMFP